MHRTFQFSLRAMLLVTLFVAVRCALRGESPFALAILGVAVAPLVRLADVGLDVGVVELCWHLLHRRLIRRRRAHHRIEQGERT